MLIYPLISYKQEFFIQDNFDIEYEKFKNEIEKAKEAALANNEKFD